MKRTTIVLPEKQVKQLEEYKKETGIAQTEAIRRAINVYFQIREEKKQKERSYLDEVV